MKYRDPKTGEVFEDIEKAHSWFCSSSGARGCQECHLYIDRTGHGCVNYRNTHPAEAARLMGYEVLGESFAERLEASVRREDPMEKKEKPRICQVLGVEVGERFKVESCSASEFWVEDGALQCEVKFPFSWDQDTANFISVLLDAPEFIIRKPPFTEEEVAIARSLHRVWPDGELRRRALDDLALYISNQYGFAMPVPADMFGSLRPGQAVRLEDIAKQ